jgi:amino acid permease
MAVLPPRTPPPLNDFFSAGLGVLKSIVTAGIFGIPILIRFIGIFPVLILLVAGGYLTFEAMHIMFTLAVRKGARTYGILAEMILGPRWGSVVRVSVGLNSWSLVFIYFILVRDTLPKVIEDRVDVSGIVWNIEGWVVLGFGLLVVLPLSLPRHVGAYRATAYYSLVYFSMLAAFVVVKLSEKGVGSGLPRDINYWDTNLTWFTAMAVLSYAFSAQQTLIPLVIDVGLKLPPAERETSMRNMFVVVILLVGMLYGGFGIMVYLTFLDATPHDAIDGYDRNDLFTDFVRVGLSIEAATSIPIMVLVARNVWFGQRGVNLEDSGEAEHGLVTAIIIATGAAAALVVPNLLTGIAFVGAILGSLILFVYPGLLMIQTWRELSIVHFPAWRRGRYGWPEYHEFSGTVDADAKDRADEDGPWAPKNKQAIAWALVVIGVVVGAISFAVELTNAIDKSILDRAG